MAVEILLPPPHWIQVTAVSSSNGGRWSKSSGVLYNSHPGADCVVWPLLAPLALTASARFPPGRTVLALITLSATT